METFPSIRLLKLLFRILLSCETFLLRPSINARPPPRPAPAPPHGARPGRPVCHRQFRVCSEHEVDQSSSPVAQSRCTHTRGARVHSEQVPPASRAQGRAAPEAFAGPHPVASFGVAPRAAPLVARGEVQLRVDGIAVDVVDRSLRSARRSGTEESVGQTEHRSTERVKGVVERQKK